MVKKEKRAKEQSKESLDEKKHINESPALLEENPGIPEPDPVTPADTIVSRQTGPQPTESSTQSKKRSSGAARGVCAMHKVVMKKAKGEKLNLRFNQVAVPVGDERHKLQSYIGMLARTMVPIDIPSWPKVDPELKEKIWNDLEDTFELIPESRKRILQSAGAKWRNFKAKLTAEYVLPYVGQKKKLQKPPKQYAFVGKKAWRRFVAVRVTKDWQEENRKQSERVGKRKYPHRVSRKGYIGLEEEEIRSGRLEPAERPDRAIMWKNARKPNDGNISPKLKKKIEQIDSLLEKQQNGEFKPDGTKDVLTTVLETPEHAGRVRGVGNFIPPTVYFDLPKKSRNHITKEQFHNLELQIAELKALIAGGNYQNSPIHQNSEKASCPGAVKEQDQEQKTRKQPVAKKLMADELMTDEDKEGADLVIIPPPGPPEQKGPRKCELAVDNIDNKVAFGVVFDEEDGLSTSVHGVPLQPGFVRVSVDGSIQDDALVPVPVIGEIETVHQAIGSHLAWPKDMISYISSTGSEVYNLNKQFKF
ncbi:uncharacterized protein LOC135152587 [Daucus carota subsp. sativus]|uniref:uncharacterized protein LOC135149165 n=1 Tax=Daucus carota subsp. sativus TaxID=79200 RepID=UPI00308296C3